MGVMTNEQVQFGTVVRDLVCCNPFSCRWAELEKQALGDDYQKVDSVHRWHEENSGEHRNLKTLEARVRRWVDDVRPNVAAGEPNREEADLYESAVTYLLYRNCKKDFNEWIRGEMGRPRTVGAVWDQFLADYQCYLPEVRFPSRVAPDRLFAAFFQIRRAFNNIFDCILGSSPKMIGLREEVWGTVFTCDIRGNIEGGYNPNAESSTLILGPSGTGKELVARAVGLSQYIPFEKDRKAFAADLKQSFFPVNLSALAPTLVESELFGHCKGAFTDAAVDRKGLLETCGEYSTLFLDEIGELEERIQVKLLRVIEERRFQRVGATGSIDFKANIVSATNRDLERTMCRGRFRRDLYYRLCSDVIRTPSLREQFQSHDSDEARHKDLSELVDFIIRRRIWASPPDRGAKGSDGKAEERINSLGERVVDWIERNLDRGYPWPGNFRELEHCVRSIQKRGTYRPIRCAKQDPETRTRRSLLALAELGPGRAWTEKELAAEYAQIVHSIYREYSAAGDVLGLEYKTVKKRLQRPSNHEE
jgi:transcriptional regulator with AAA-type ATPase domain